MNNPYKLNPTAIREFMQYHGIDNLKEVAEILKISAAYLSQVMSGTRRLNEELRLRLQIVTRKRQDQLFIPNPDALPFSPQSFNMAKYYGFLPYDEGSLTAVFREENPQKADRSWVPQARQDFGVDGRAQYMKLKNMQKT